MARETANAGSKTNGGTNTAIRERRRQQLIESTISSIAKRGLSDTTMGEVAKGAKLSHGIVNFHFKSKEQLLVETLRAVTEEYRSVWTRAVERAGPGLGDKLAALYLADLDPAICTRKKVAVWFAFYGEAKSRPVIRALRDAGPPPRPQPESILALARCPQVKHQTPIATEEHPPRAAEFGDVRRRHASLGLVGVLRFADERAAGNQDLRRHPARRIQAIHDHVKRFDVTLACPDRSKHKLCIRRPRRTNLDSFPRGATCPSLGQSTCHSRHRATPGGSQE